MVVSALLFAAARLSGCSTAPTTTLPTVVSVDPARDAGRWYEVASLPNRFQAPCVTDTQARYRVTAEDMEVTNRCR